MIAWMQWEHWREDPFWNQKINENQYHGEHQSQVLIESIGLQFYRIAAILQLRFLHFCPNFGYESKPQNLSTNSSQIWERSWWGDTFAWDAQVERDVHGTWEFHKWSASKLLRKESLLRILSLPKLSAMAMAYLSKLNNCWNLLTDFNKTLPTLSIKSLHLNIREVKVQLGHGDLQSHFSATSPIKWLIEVSNWDLRFKS